MAKTVPVYEWTFSDGVVAGCGTQFEYDHWSAEGTLDGVSLGKVLCYEPTSMDEKRARLWARVAA